MNYCLLILIRLYWLIPKKYRNPCIFRESCSNHVYRIVKNEGFKKGLSAIKERKQKCKPGYYYINKEQVRLADKSIVSTTLLNESIL